MAKPTPQKPGSVSSGSARLRTAAVVLPFLIASILVPWLKWLFVAMAVAAMGLALFEFYVLAKQQQLKPDTGAGFLAAIAILVISFFATDLWLNLLLVQFVIIALTAGTLVATTLRGAPFDKMLASVGSTILGVLYIAFLGSHLVSTRVSFPQELAADLLSFFFLVLMGADAGAYYLGRAIGKRKLAPSISPGKSWEGVLGGVAAALVMAWVAHIWFFRELPLKYALPLAVAMTVVGIFGDLAESALKRGSGAKDAATILPGHGGLLDRLDSLLFNAPLLYYFARFYFSSALQVGTAG
ncbi:MAG TPA: phosphatidate cytidylyltransferase [Pyrinomonadaceae bacterium]|nr:phosphatidate cytidylyltransferase [Pyrinomonadaceae bacterium]